MELCLQDCRATAEAKLSPTAQQVPPEINQQLQQCADRCQAKFLSLVPNLFARINEAVKQASSS